MARWEVGPPGASVVAFTEEHTVLFKDGCAVGNGGIQEYHGAVAIGEKTVVRKGQSGELDLVVIVGKNQRLSGLARGFYFGGGGAEEAGSS